MAQPPDTHPITLDSGDILYVPNRYGPEETERLQREYNRIDAANASNVVPTGDTGENAPLAYPDPDPSESDSWPTYLAKGAGAALHGTGRGLAGLGDLGLSGANAALELVTNPVRQLRGEEPRSTGFMHPLTKAYDEYLPASPEGSDYEAVHGPAEMFGPIAATELISGGLATPEALTAIRGASFLPKAAEVASTALVKPALRSATTGTTGIIGGEAGGAAGKAIAGETGETLGTLLGGMVGPAGGVPATKHTASALTTDAQSATKLQAVKDLNKNLPADKQIPATIGLVGTPGMGIAEDLTARGIFSGGPAIRARRALYEGMEQAVIDASAKVRGRNTGVSQPARGNITKESLGRETDFMATDALAKAKQKISDIEDQLEADIGKGTPIDPAPFYAVMDNIINDPDTAVELVSHAKQMVRKFEAEMPRTEPATGIGPPYLENPSYGRVRGHRSRVGSQIDKETSLPIDLGIQKQARGGMSEALDQTAIAQGVPDFAAKQKEVSELHKDVDKIEPATTAATEGAAGNILFNARDKKSLEQFAPYAKHVPETLGPIMANALELNLRGGNAGILKPIPESFEPTLLERNWKSTDEDFRTEYSGKDPDVKKTLDDAAILAEAERVRPGKRATPGNKGSTIGASSAVTQLLPSLLGGAAGAFVSPGTAIAGALASPALAVGNYLTGRALTSPRIAEALVNPTTRLRDSIRLALEGATAEGGYQNRQMEQDREAQREAEKIRRGL
jgi:hypothetical protein